MEPVVKEQLRVYVNQDVIAWMKNRQKKTGVSLSRQVNSALMEQMRNDTE